MKLIDLLNMMAKGEKLPSKIRLFNEVFEYDEDEKTYLDKDGYTFDDYCLMDSLNEEIEQEEWSITLNSNNITFTKNGDAIMTFSSEESSRKDKLLAIIEHYELEKQLKYIHTEYFELDEAIIDYCDDEYTYMDEVEKNHQEHIAEELADIMVMLKQFQYYFDIEDEEIEKIMDSKIDRQLDRIEGEK